MAWCSLAPRQCSPSSADCNCINCSQKHNQSPISEIHRATDIQISKTHDLSAHDTPPRFVSSSCILAFNPIMPRHFNTCSHACFHVRPPSALLSPSINLLASPSPYPSSGRGLRVTPLLAFLPCSTVSHLASSHPLLTLFVPFVSYSTDLDVSSARHTPCCPSPCPMSHGPQIPQTSRVAHPFWVTYKTNTLLSHITPTHSPLISHFITSSF